MSIADAASEGRPMSALEAYALRHIREAVADVAAERDGARAEVERLKSVVNKLLLEEAELSASRDALRAEVKRLEHQLVVLLEEIAARRHREERLTRERDEAVAALDYERDAIQAYCDSSDADAAKCSALMARVGALEKALRDIATEYTVEALLDKHEEVHGPACGGCGRPLNHGKDICRCSLAAARSALSEVAK